MDSIVNEYLFNKSKGDNEYLFYDKKCLQFKIVRNHNNCYWSFLNKWGYPFGERQFDPILLLSEHKYRMNMHNNFQDNDIFLHSRKGDARQQVIKWIYEYDISVDKVWEKLP